MRDWLVAAAERSPDAAVLWEYDAASGVPIALTFAQLDEQVARKAAWLASIGIEQGLRVAILTERSAQAIVAILALLRIGALIVPLNTRLTREETHYQLTVGATTWLLHDAAHQLQARWLAEMLPLLQIAQVDAENQEDSAPETLDTIQNPYDVEAVSFNLFTSGTTGKPKAAQLTLGNFLANATASAERIGASADDIWLIPLPLYHVGGLAILFRSLLDGSSFVLPNPKLNSTEALLHAFQTMPITHVSLVPTQLYRLLEAGFTGTPYLRLILLGGAAASLDLLKQCCEQGIPVATTYGLTEATSQVATMLPSRVCAKLGSVGKPLPGTKVRIADEMGETLPTGDIGEIVVSGMTVMRGYLEAPDDPALRNGELYTGDLGYLDADGDLWVVQRRSDLIVSGGENVYPVEVENALREHPAIADVLVVGVPNAEWGQQVVAAVVVKPNAHVTENELDAFVQTRLAAYKRPRQYRFVDQLPYTASGKPQRHLAQKIVTSDEEKTREGVLGCCRGINPAAKQG